MPNVFNLLFPDTKSDIIQFDRFSDVVRGEGEGEGVRGEGVRGRGSFTPYACTT